MMHWPGIRERALPVLAALILSPTLCAAVQGPAITGPKVGELRSHVPAAQRFVVHGTMPVARGPFQRTQCPYVVVDPSGTPLSTQWELVLVAKDFMVVELLANAVNNGGWSGEQRFDVYTGTSPFVFGAFDPPTVYSLFTSSTLGFRVIDATGRSHPIVLTGPTLPTSYVRFGPAAVTIERTFQSAWGGLQAWMTVRANSKDIEVILNWHNGGLPAQPDVYFNQVSLDTASTLEWTPLLPDPAAAPPLLVCPDQHVLPQRWERAFRLIVHPTGSTPDTSLEGWAVGDWSQGGYLPQAIALPSLAGVPINLTPKKDDDFYRLQNNLPTVPGNPPVSALWPAQGVYYGGMTSGTEIEPLPAVPLAVSGQPDGLLSLYIEQLRYGARHMGCIYDGGQPVEQDRYLSANGSTPWDLFDNVFLGKPPKDAPFDFSKTGPGYGSASYDPRIYEPIDYQHYVRRTKANLALVWLDNDPLAKLHVRMDAELGRMCYYEGPGGRLQVPTTPGQGVGFGRGEGWVASVMAAAYAIGDGAWRARNWAWFDTFRNVLATAQMPNQLFSAQSTGKMATLPPYGDGKNAFYWVHRSDEQIVLLHALQAIEACVGLDCSDLIRTGAEGIWNFAWKPGTTGVLDIYPAGPIGGARYANRSQIPAGLTSTVPDDAFHVPLALHYGALHGANMLPALYAYTGATSLPGALAIFQSTGIKNLENRAGALALLQKLFP
jgi:hypothetical protein